MIHKSSLDDGLQYRTPGGGGGIIKNWKAISADNIWLYTDKDHVFLFLVTTRVQCSTSSNEGSGGAWEGVGHGPCFG